MASAFNMGAPAVLPDATALVEVHLLGADAPAFAVFGGATGPCEARQVGTAWLQDPNTVQVLLHHRRPDGWACVAVRWSPCFGGAPLGGEEPPPAAHLNCRCT